MQIKIALAGNPNSGKTTLFNALTGSNQFVGNWPGVTVEKKEGKLKSNKEVIVMDLPGIYSLSPYTLEEVVARNYLINERPNAILNIVDGTNLERNLYLTTQLLELGIPVVTAVNMMDIVKKNGDNINLDALSKALGCKVVPISALKGDGIKKAAEEAVAAAQKAESFKSKHEFSSEVEGYLAEISAKLDSSIPENQKRFYAVKIFERDDKIGEVLDIIPNVEDIIAKAEKSFDDDSESIITNERYNYISSIIGKCSAKKSKSKLSTSDKIDRIVTNRWLALPIFAVVMFIVYYVSVTTVGTWATDWANDGVFGDGWFLGPGSAAYSEAAEEYDSAQAAIEAFLGAAEEEGIDTAAVSEALENGDVYAEDVVSFLDEAKDIETSYDVTSDEDGSTETFDVGADDFKEALAVEEPDTADFGLYIPGIPVIIEGLLNLLNVNPDGWVWGLILDGIVAGVGAVLGFVPQMLVLFIFLGFLESCGYMARIAFIMDRIFRKFGLSGKSFIPILIGTGCGIPGIMASRTIENERDRRMTIMTTTFIPCGAKLPIIALIAGALFGGEAWVAPSAYFVGIAAIICSGIILKKTKMFSGDPAPFVMELPAYHMPTVGNVLRSMWERGWSFIKKAGTVILLSAIALWFLQGFGVVDGSFGMLAEEDLDKSILAVIGRAIQVVFAPLGWGNWKAAVAAITGLIAKENVVGTFGILYGNSDMSLWDALQADFSQLAAYSFLVFNLLCAPCFAAMGAIKREMNNAKWTFFAIGYQCVFAYIVSLCIYQIGSLVTGNVNIGGLIAAIILVVLFFYLLFRPSKQSNTLKVNKKIMNV